MHAMKNGNVENSSEMGNGSVNIEKGKQLMATKSQTNYQHKYPEPLADYKDVVEDRKLFMDTLAKLHATMGTKFMIPVIAGRELDLHQLFVEVTSRGGLEKAISDRKWREIIATFNFPSTATNASFVLRKYYMSLLHHYEKIYFFGSQGWNPPPPASSNKLSTTSVPSGWSVSKPMLQPYSSAPSVAIASPASSNKLSTTSVPSGRSVKPMLQPSSSAPSVAIASPGPSELLNKSISGVIDGKFADGYFVTVTVGAQKLKGVLYHAPEQTQDQAADISEIADIGNDRVVRHSRRKKVGERDPAHSKPNSSGYNCFFAEQHARLKLHHSGTDREISKMIGDLWNGLPESEKAVYQERGSDDKERYSKEGSKMGLVITEAVPIQQRHPVVPVGTTFEGYLAVGAENSGSSFDDGSDTDSMMSDDGSEYASMVADPSNGGEVFDLKVKGA